MKNKKQKNYYLSILKFLIEILNRINIEFLFKNFNMDLRICISCIENDIFYYCTSVIAIYSKTVLIIDIKIIKD